MPPPPFGGVTDFLTPLNTDFRGRLYQNHRLINESLPTRFLLHSQMAKCKNDLFVSLQALIHLIGCFADVQGIAVSSHEFLKVVFFFDLWIEIGFQGWRNVIESGRAKISRFSKGLK